MAGRISERELIIPALRAAASRPDGYISTAHLIRELEEQFQPEGQDAETLDGRQDTHFSQKVRNLISHREAGASMFRKGYAEYTRDGIRITEEGRTFLAQAPEFE